MKPEDHYHYSTSELARYYGLTAKGLAFYEDKGIISPRRIPGSKYREFTLVDCYHLYDSKFYSNCGFSLAETADLIQHKDLAFVQNELHQKSLQIQQEILYKERLKHHVDRIAGLMAHIEELTQQFQVVNSPSFYRLFVRHYCSPHSSTPEQSREFARWNHDVPINVASLKYSREELLQGAPFLNVGIGNIILEEDFQRLNYSPSSRTEYLPSCLCVYTVIQGSEEELYLPGRLAPCLDFISKNHYQLAGDPFTSMITVANTPEGRIRFDEVWFPVEKAGAAAPCKSPQTSPEAG